jgi:hypothetical protein
MKLPTLPKAAYAVTDPNGTHRYRIEMPDKKTVIPKLKSVTGALGVINKPLLIPWATNQGIARSVASLIIRVGAAGHDEIDATANWIADAIKTAKRAGGKNGWAPALAEVLAGKFELNKGAALDANFLAAMAEAASKQPDKVKEEAAGVGAQVHAAIEAIIKGEEPVVPERIRQPVAEFRTWFAGTKTRIVAQELVVGSAKHLFGGRLDALGLREIDGRWRWGIADWKTSSGIYEEMALQVAGGYAIALEEQFPGIKIEWCDIIRFAKAEPYGSEAKPVVNMDVARRAFLGALQLGRDLETEFFGPASYSTFEARAAAKTEATAETKKKVALPAGQQF